MHDSIAPVSVPSDDDMEGIRSWVKDRLGIRFEEAQLGIFKTRMAMYCRAVHSNAKETLTRLKFGDSLVERAVAEVVSTNHTSFFREQEMFSYFVSTILPSLPTDTPLRLWSAAASSGEEAYSMAYCIRHALGPAANAIVLGTDISERQVRRAEQALYPRTELAHLPGQLRELLEPHGPDALTVHPGVKALCTFRRMNLTQFPWPFQQRFHVIFLRNVLYYFDSEMQERIIEACYEAVEPGGWLVTSLTEPMLGVTTRWQRFVPGVHRKTA